MCARVYSKLKAFNVKWRPTYTANVGFSASQPHALKREIYLMMSWPRGVASVPPDAARQIEKVHEDDEEREMYVIIFLKCKALFTLLFSRGGE